MRVKRLIYQGNMMLFLKDTGKPTSGNSNSLPNAETEVQKVQYPPWSHPQKRFQPQKRQPQWHKMQPRLLSPLSTCRLSQNHHHCCPSL
uniref:activating transcription factor 7-interacting protein 2 isoform X5 n=1 Tax=Panthera onca TaxID=9690 RepID=UPI0007663B0E|nr:activating transcription factor 7-interacting protein 2 isoform X5 [Panthera onca]